MSDLIKALTILSKYMTPSELKYPTNCDHDILMVCCRKQLLSDEDMAELEKCSFEWNDEYDCWTSYRFGSA